MKLYQILLAVLAIALPAAAQPPGLNLSSPGFVGSLALPPINVSNRSLNATTGGAGLSNGTTDLSSSSRTLHYITAACRDLTVDFMNSTGQPGVVVPGTITVTAAWDDGTTVTPLTFGGASSISLGPEAIGTSDPIPGVRAKGSTIWIRTCYTVTSGAKYPKNWFSSPAYSGEAYKSNVDGTLDTVASYVALGASQSFGVGPYMVRGTPSAKVPVIGLIGDSIQNSGAGSDISFYGLGLRAMGVDYGKAYAHVMVAISGQTAANWKATDKPYSYAALARAGVTSIFSNLGTNDIHLSNAPLATVQASLLAVWSDNAALGRKVYQSTILPYTNSTDGFVTTANQTIHNSAQNTVRINLNNWLRDGAPIISGAAVAVGTGGALRTGDAGHPLYYFFEIADLAETSRDSGIWIAPPAKTVDGLHPTPSGFSSITPGINPLLFQMILTGGGAAASRRKARAAWDRLKRASDRRKARAAIIPK